MQMITESEWLKTFTNSHIEQFKAFIWDYYRTYGRQFRWRHIDNPYYVVVSEVMLQQTQTSRVEQKYPVFLCNFPTLADLARADLCSVLTAWQGLGYNRRGKFLHELAQTVFTEYGGIIPNKEKLLQGLPGIGAATAASVCAFAFNQPTVFIETNIRAVFLHCFFSEQVGIHDKQLLPLITETVDMQNPREWYYALMDYGVFLKKQLENPSRASAHHTKQSMFEGSNRQLRGRIIALLTQQQYMSIDHLCCALKREPSRVAAVVASLCRDRLISCVEGRCTIS